MTAAASANQNRWRKSRRALEAECIEAEAEAETSHEQKVSGDLATGTAMSSTSATTTVTATETATVPAMAVSSPHMSHAIDTGASDVMKATERQSTGSTWRRARAAQVEDISSETTADKIGRTAAGVEQVPPLTREGRARPGLGCSIRLRRGLQMPQLGLGGGGLEGAAGRDAVAAALNAGYRLIDTALFYKTEKEIAQGIRMAGLQRSDVFISTKVLQKSHVSNEQVRASLKESLKNLGTNYVDLYLIHNPRAGRIKEVWSLLLQFREEGLAKSVGVSNFGIGQLEGLRQAGLELPEVNQIEVHCWRQLPEVVAYHKKYGIATMCMAPLARGRMFGKSDLATLSHELGRTEAEVAIRWSLQKGYIPIPKSINPDRIWLNAAEGFDLSERHMARIAKLDTGYMSCTMASPCHELGWELVADGIPHPDTWGGGRNKGKGGGKGKSKDHTTFMGYR
eukprot:TRINITY_DN48074_c0_g1_i1.p1 TRINITY_DN48074_c0_g1~~TRINITY_DN48074_c0_g1_i1.p1  ORF type:complete len:454 (-),score=96.53 TRINITY_DN48074_c0_g1_i1:484-1845(-)